MVHDLWCIPYSVAVKRSALIMRGSGDSFSRFEPLIMTPVDHALGVVTDFDEFPALIQGPHGGAPK